MSIEAWVTTLDGTYLAHLERSTESPFRRFAFGVELGDPSAGSLEYHLDNEIVRAHDDLFAMDDRLVWMRYRNRTVAWPIEQRASVLDKSEHESDWVKVAGRGSRQLLADRIVWPTEFDETHTDPLEWGAGKWTTKTDAAAAAGQAVVPVVSTTSGTGAVVGIPVKITGGPYSQIGIIRSIVAGVSIELEDDLAYPFPIGSRVVGATDQWRRFVNRAAGEMLWDLIAESNPRFETQLVRGVIETTGQDGWTQDLRFDNLHDDVVKDVEAKYGDVEVNGLTVNYYNVQGTDRTGEVVLEEGADLVKLAFEESVRNALSFVVPEGTGEAVYAPLAVVEKPTRTTRKTPAKKTPVRRKAPEAPAKVELQRVDYPILHTAEALPVKRRREAYVDAKDQRTIVQLEETGRAVLEEHAIEDGVGFEAVETRYQAGIHYDLGDWIRFVAPSRGVDEDARIVALVYVEDDDETVRVGAEVNTARQEKLLRLKGQVDKTASSVGVRNRQPQGQLVPYSFGGSGIFDTGSPLYVFVKVVDELSPIVKVHCTLAFRQFLAPATAAAAVSAQTSDSGGGSTSGSSSASSAGNTTVGLGLSNGYNVVGTSGAASAGTAHTHGGGGYEILERDYVVDVDTHTHTIAHTHTTPAHDHTIPGHGHGLTYGTFEEAFPVSHSVTVRVYEREDTTWTLRGTLSGLTADLADIDDFVTSVITHPGDWRFTIQSEAAQPNGGRMGCDVYGAVKGAMQSA